MLDVFWGLRSKVFHGIKDGGARATVIGDLTRARIHNGASVFNVDNPANEPMGGHYHDPSGGSFETKNTMYVNIKRTDIYIEDGSIGRPYKTIMACINAITDATSLNRYLVLVCPGIYNEQVIMKEWVYLQGEEKDACIVKRGTLPLVYNVNSTAIYTMTFEVANANGKFAFINGGGSQVEIHMYDCFLQGTGDDRNVLEFANNVNAYLYETEGDNSGKKIITSLVGGSNIQLNLEASYLAGGIAWDGGILKIFNVELLDDGNIDFNSGNCRFDYLWVENTSTYAIKFGTTGEIICKALVLASGGAQDTIQLTAVPSYLEFTSCSIQSSGAYSISATSLISGAVVEANYFEKPAYNVQNTTSFAYDVSSLAPAASSIFTHSPDIPFARVCQVSRYTPANDSSLDYDVADEGLFVQEDAIKTDFVGGQVQLAGTLFPYAHWMLNESSGNIVADSSGNGRNGLRVNMEDIDWVAGKLNNCLQFDGIDEYVNCGNIANFERTDLFSYEFWFSTTSVVLKMILGKYDHITNKGLMIYVDTGQVTFDFRSSSSGYLAVKTTETFNDGNWHHCIITYDGTFHPSGVKIYVDGSSRVLSTLKDTLTSSTLNGESFCVGRRAAGNYFVGKIDEVVIYTQILSVSEVVLRWNGGVGTESTGYDITKGWYVRTNTNQINTSTWFNIGRMAITQTTPTNTDIKYLFSVDGRTTWKAWNGATWIAVSLVNIDTQGNTQTQINALTDGQWALLFVAGTLDVVASLKSIDAAVTPSLSLINITYLLSSRHLCYDADLVIEFLNATQTKITNTLSPPETLYGLKANIFLLGKGLT